MRTLAPLSIPALSRVLLAVVMAIVVARVGLGLATPHYAPQAPNCPWSFAVPGSSAPPPRPLCSGAATAAEPVAVQRGATLPALLVHAAGVTLAPLTMAMLLATLIGVPIGAWAAAGAQAKGLRARFANLLLSLSTAGIALPGFLISFAIVFAEIGWVTRTGHPLVKFLDYQFDAAHLAMPTLALTFAPAAILAQSAAASLGLIYDQDYVRAARGRGIDGLRLFWGHVLPVAVPQLLAAGAAGAQLALTTIPLLEYLFNWPGLGLVMLDAVEEQDRAALAAALGIFAAAFTLLGLLADRAGLRQRAAAMASTP